MNKTEEMTRLVLDPDIPLFEREKNEGDNISNKLLLTYEALKPVSLNQSLMKRCMEGREGTGVMLVEGVVCKEGRPHPWGTPKPCFRSNSRPNIDILIPRNSRK